MKLYLICLNARSKYLLALIEFQESVSIGERNGYESEYRMKL